MPDPITRNVSGEDLTDRFIENHTVAASPAAAAITTVATLTWNPQTSPTVVNGAFLEAAVALTVGTNGVSVLMQIRRTNTTGTVIATTGPVTATAGNLVALSTRGIDQVAFNPGQVWVVCLTVASGSAPSTVSSVQIVGTIV